MTGDVVNDLLVISEEPNVRIMETKALVCDIEPGRRARGPEALEQLERTSGATGMSATIDCISDRLDLCIGCKACEVACKEWNGLSEDGLNWSGIPTTTPARRPLDLAAREVCRRRARARDSAAMSGDLQSWGFSSDVCKHCEDAGCLEACPTGSIVRTEFGGVYIQPDVCNGCGYCVVACPFGVVQRNPDDGRAFKCTFCYDRQKVGLAAGLRQGLPDGVDQVRDARRLQLDAEERLQELQSRGMDDANSTIRATPAWAASTRCSSCAAIRGNIICRPSPRCPTIYLKAGWTGSAVAAGLLLFGSIFAFLGSAKR